jgi:hypothetical protein
MTDKKKKTEKEDVPEANVIFVGKRQKLNKESGKYETVAREAPAYITDGGKKIVLPESDAQRKGFYSDEAARLVELFPSDYKFLKAKGATN